jgi:hypothetical protein
MMKNQQHIGERERQRSEKLTPLLKPRNLHFWLKDYEKESNAQFGDASTFVFTQVYPPYNEDNFDTYLMNKLNLDWEEYNGIDPELWKLEKRLWFNNRTKFGDNLFRMFNDMVLHFSNESSNLIEAFEEDFNESSTDKNPRTLLKLVKKSHTQAGHTVSREEKEQKKDRLKAHRQWDSHGKVHDIHKHNNLFKDLLDDTREVGVTYDHADIVDMYLKSVDNCLIEADLARIKVEKCAEMPKTLETAQFWVIEANRRNQSIQDNRPGNQKRKAQDQQLEQLKQVLTADHTTDTTANPEGTTTLYPECFFCKKNHLGGAQECVYLKQHLADYPDLAAATLEKKVSFPSSKHLSGGKAGKGGKGGGRGGGKGRGRGKEGRGGNASVHTAANKAADESDDDTMDDTWADFNREQALSSYK